jgi:hypothetical protein
MKRLLKNILLYLLGGMIGLVMLEVFYQIVEINLPYHELSPTVGKKMLPSRRITYLEDGFYLGKTNKFGYLGDPYPPEKEKGKIRIALIGDSYTEGFHVFNQHHFSQILKRELNNGLDTPKYEVLNFGIGNYNYNDMVILYKNFIEGFDCDILMFILEANDFDFRSNFIPSPVLKINGDSLLIDYSFTHSRVFKYYDKFSFFFENSCFIKAANNAYKLMKKDMIKQIVFGKFYKTKEQSEEVEKDVKKVDGKIVDDRVIKSLDWFKGKKTYFVFKSEGTPELLSLFPKYGIGCVALEPILDEKLTKKGIIYDYWDVTNMRGHWNHSAQIVVGKALSDLVKNNEE